MFLIVIRKMMSNLWMLACALLGAIITVAMVSSIPIYTDGIMQRMLAKDLETMQKETGRFSGGYQIGFRTLFTNTIDKNLRDLNAVGKQVELMSGRIGLPVLAQRNELTSMKLAIWKEDIEKYDFSYMVAMSQLQDHVKLVHGRMFSGKKADGAYEVIASEEAMKEQDLVLDKTYTISRENSFAMTKPTPENSFKIRIVGVFTYNTRDDPYWYSGIEPYKESFLMDINLMRNSFFRDEKVYIDNEKWYYAFDYHKIKLEKVPVLVTAVEEQFKLYKKLTAEAEMPVMEVLKKYDERKKELSTTLLVLQIPILLMLAFYTFMISKLKIDFEGNEIAVLKSRGASSMLIFGTYLTESSIIGIAALLAGPVLGLFLCKILGASNGFLEFVQRISLPLALKPDVYVYSAAAVIFISGSMLIPAFRASRTSIVLYKRKKSRGSEISFWKRFYIDFVLLAVSFYGYYGYQKQQKVIFLSGIKGTELTIDPLLFLISTMFIIGSGLFILRAFPYAVRFVFWLGRKIWSPVFYASFIQVGRTSGQEQFVMIFLILTLSVGIFNANSARTINRNMEEKMSYETGADIVVKGAWSSNMPAGSGTLVQMPTKASELYYYEPLYDPYTKLSGVEAVTKVFKEDNATAFINGGSTKNTTIMGVIPGEFGKVAWFRPSLLKTHWYNYLNFMTDDPSAVLVSRAFANEFKVKPGDEITVTWGVTVSKNGVSARSRGINGVVYGIVDYWPSLNPNRKVDDKAAPYFVVANLTYIQNLNFVEPYEIWMKKKPGAGSSEVYNDMSAKGIELTNRADTSEKIIQRKNDPMLQGTNGSLTLDFIVTIIISIIGFLIYWIMSIKKRVLQFGILRAMGLSSGKVAGMIVCEQFLITGTSVLSGIFIGNLTSGIFVPMFQLVYGAQGQVPPFQVISNPADYLRLYVIVALTLVLCFLILRKIILGINVSQALKLGED